MIHAKPGHSLCDPHCGKDNNLRQLGESYGTLYFLAYLQKTIGNCPYLLFFGKAYAMLLPFIAFCWGLQLCFCSEQTDRDV